MPIPVSTITINSSSGEAITSTEFNFSAAGGMTISGDSSTNTITFTAFGGLSTPPNSVLITDASGVASFQTTLPSTVQGNITEVGVISTGVWQSTSPIGIGYGGTGAASMSNPYGAIYYDGASLATTNVGSSGDILTSNGPGFAPSFQTGASTSITIDGDSGSSTGSSFVISGGIGGFLKTSFTGTTLNIVPNTALSLTYGGTNNNLTASSGSVVYSNATQLALTLTGESGQILQSAGTSAPSWSTATYPSATTINQILYSSGTNVVTGLTSSANGVLTTGTSGTPVMTTLASNGQLIIGSSSGAPAAANLTASTGISVSNGANSITIANTSPLSGFTVDADAGSSTPSSNTITISGGTTGLTTSASGSTIDLTGTLKLASGGTNANLTASNGGIFYSTATAGAILSGTATANLPLLSGSSTTPGWSAITYPTSAVAGNLIYASTATALSALATANNGVLTTGTSGTPVITTLASNGQLIVGSSSGAPAAANLTASTGISISNGSNSITITNTSPLSSFTLDADTGSATPSSNTITISGGSTGLTTSASGSTIDLTGTLNIINGGTNATTMADAYGTIYYDGAKLATTSAGSSGYILTSNGPGLAPSFKMGSGSSITISGDTGSSTGGSFVISGGGGFLTTSFTGTTLDIVPNAPLGLSYGGMNASLSASNGGIFYSTATAGAILSGTATANLPLISGSSAAPTWATIAYPTTGTASSFGVVYYDGTNTKLATTSAGTSGYILTSNGPGVAPSFKMGSGSSITISGDTGSSTGGSFVISGGGGFLTTSFTGTTLDIVPNAALSLTYGGTNANLTASNGGIFYSTATAGAILSGTATANQILLSGSSAAPSWSTATYPPATTINQLLYSSSNNVVTGLATASSAVLTTSSSVPTWASELSLALGGTNANLTASNGGIFYSTSTAGAILSGTATANLPLLSGSSTTPGWAAITYPTSASAGDLIYASTSTALSALATANNGVLVTNGSGVPSISSTLPSTVQLNISQVGTLTAGTWNGTLIGIAYGGTGASSMANTNGVVYYNGTSLVTTSAGTSGYVLTSNGSGSAPTFQVLSDANLILPITFVSSNYTATATDYFISANTTTSAITIELPSAPTTGRAYIVKDSQGTSGTRQITVAAGGTVLLDGASSFVINTNYESVNFVFDGTNYEAF